jgi:hypothetical protein
MYFTPGSAISIVLATNIEVGSSLAFNPFAHFPATKTTLLAEIIQPYAIRDACKGSAKYRVQRGR